MTVFSRHPHMFHLLITHRNLLSVVFCCAILLVPALHSGQAAPAENTAEGATLASSLANHRFSATRLFVRPVSEQDAAIIAEAVARAKALQSVVRVLATLPEVRISGTVGLTSVNPPNLLALARATAQTSVLLVSKSRKPPAVTITVTLLDDGDGPSMEARVRDALMHPDRLELYAKAVLRENALLDAFDALTSSQDASSDAAADTASPSSRPLPQASASAIQSIINEIKALAVFAELLPSYNGIWEDPATVRNAMQQALALAPESTLCRNTLGDASLQLGRSQEALEEQTRVIGTDPSFARAFHSRGAASLALGHFSSAVADFSEAIRFSPYVASYYRSRGMARHLLGETNAMCSDLYRACTLGECNEFQWAVANEYCSASQNFE